jgi:hypothetical protein
MRLVAFLLFFFYNYSLHRSDSVALSFNFINQISQAIYNTIVKYFLQLFLILLFLSVKLLVSLFDKSLNILVQLVRVG